MAKKYYQSKMDRKSESSGMKRFMREMNEGPVRANHGREMHNDEHMHSKENEYTMRHMTGGYLTEDHNQVANLPQNVVYRPYGDPIGYLDQRIDDTISGIDRQRGIDMKKAMDHFFPKKV